MTTHSETQIIAREHLFWLLLTIILGALAFSYDGLFLGLTQGRLLRNAMLVSTCLIFTPLAWIAFSLESNFLLWVAMAAFMAARAITLAIKAKLILKNPDL